MAFKMMFSTTAVELMRELTAAMTGVFQQDQIDLRDTAEYVGECNSA